MAKERKSTKNMRLKIRMELRGEKVTVISDMLTVTGDRDSRGEVTSPFLILLLCSSPLA
jgi:hypothetical protein